MPDRLNVVVDLAADRRPWADDAVRFFDAAITRGVELLFSAASITTLFYVVRREGNASSAMRAIDFALASMTIVPADRATVAAAVALAGRDFEDDLHIATALDAGADLIVTRNGRDFERSPIRAVDAAEALHLITA